MDEALGLSMAMIGVCKWMCCSSGPRCCSSYWLSKDRAEAAGSVGAPLMHLDGHEEWPEGPRSRSAVKFIVEDDKSKLRDFCRLPHHSRPERDAARGLTL